MALVDATQDAYLEMVMDEGEVAFAEGVRIGIMVMAEDLDYDKG